MPDYFPLTVRLTADERAALDAFAEAQGLPSTAAALRFLVRRALAVQTVADVRRRRPAKGGRK